MANVLVTGGAGFIGGNFVHYWNAKHPEDHVVVLDALTYAGNRSTLEGAPNASLVEGDIRDTDLVERLLREHAITTLVHFAAESHVDRSISGPDDFINTNILGTNSLLEAARSVWLSGTGTPHRFHHISTDEVFGSLGEEGFFTETSAYDPRSPYSASKASSDHLVRAWWHTYGLPTLVTNCSNNYGPYHFPEKLIPLMIIKCLEGQALPVYGTGDNVRDWLFVDDHVRALTRVFEAGRPGETYNIGGNAERTNLTVVEAICRGLDRLRPRADGRSYREQVSFVADRPGHDHRYAIDATKIRDELGWAPEESFETGIDRTIRWYLDNEDWWRAIRARGYQGERLGLKQG